MVPAIQPIGVVSMKQEVAKFTITVPDGHPEAGKKIEKAFEFQVCESNDEAQTVLDTKTKDNVSGWTLADLVNDKLKANARSNAYQNALAPYRPSEVSPEEIKARTIRDLIRLGMSEEQATAMVESGLAANKAE